MGTLLAFSSLSLRNIRTGSGRKSGHYRAGRRRRKGGRAADDGDGSDSESEMAQARAPPARSARTLSCRSLVRSLVRWLARSRLAPKLASHLARLCPRPAVPLPPPSGGGRCPRGRCQGQGAQREGRGREGRGGRCLGGGARKLKIDGEGARAGGAISERPRSDLFGPFGGVWTPCPRSPPLNSLPLSFVSSGSSGESGCGPSPPGEGDGRLARPFRAEGGGRGPPPGESCLFFFLPMSPPTLPSPVYSDSDLLLL